MAYTAALDAVPEAQWHRDLQAFDDATVFQTGAHGRARWGDGNLARVVVRNDGDVVAMAQAALVGAPLIGRRLAFVNFGPAWQRRDAPRDPEHLAAALRALRDAFVKERGLYLRLRPWSHGTLDLFRDAAAAEGFTEETEIPYRTFVLDLAPDEDRLRSAMDKKWRANLRKAEKSGVEVTVEEGDAGARVFAGLHGQLVARKAFTSDFMGLLPTLEAELPADVRLRYFVARHGGQPVAVAIVSAMGDRAIYLNGASGDAALETRAGHLLQWSIVRWLKQDGRFRWYDLHGATSSPGVRQFKRGLFGARAPEVPMPEFAACNSRLLSSVVHTASRLRPHLERLRRGTG